MPQANAVANTEELARVRSTKSVPLGNVAHERIHEELHEEQVIVEMFPPGGITCGPLATITGEQKMPIAG